MIYNIHKIYNNTIKKLIKVSPEDTDGDIPIKGEARFVCHGGLFSAEWITLTAG
jgi:hypothetical protein